LITGVVVKPLNRDIIYLGSTEKDANKLPEEVKELFSYALIVARAGGEHEDAKPLKGFGGRGVMEVVADDRSGTYREVYTVRFEEAIYVLHIFQKKSKKGIATSKQDIELIKQRLKWAEALHKEKYGKKKTKN
jgi:phage-related protein